MLGNFKYRLLYFVAFVVAFLGMLGVKLIIVGIAVSIALFIEKHNADFGLIVGYIIGLAVGAVLYIGLEKVYPYIEKIDEYSKKYKQFPYTEKYGKNYPEPRAEDFGITQTEFKDYNSRFQFSYIKMIFTYGLWIITCIYSLRSKNKGSDAIVLMGVTGIVAILLNYIFNYWNLRISRKHRYYEKIHKFQESRRIFSKIREENSNF